MNDRININQKDWLNIYEEFQEIMKNILQDVESGAFISPQEVVGMAYGQMMKLSSEADKYLYTKDPQEAKRRMLKFAYGLLLGAASMNKLEEK